MSYALLDSGEGLKLEQFGRYRLIRPAAQAIWPKGDPSIWRGSHAQFDRTRGWSREDALPRHWFCTEQGVRFKIVPTSFGHLGFFPEHLIHWDWISRQLPLAGEVLHLFGYCGGASLYLAQLGLKVAHVDASKSSVTWTKENLELNRLDRAPVRLIVDDACKFVARERRRGRTYSAILLDPPTFGRGPKQELFKIEERLFSLLETCQALLSPYGNRFILLSAHTPGLTPALLATTLGKVMGSEGLIESGEMLLTGKSVLPSGSFARWQSGKGTS